MKRFALWCWRKVEEPILKMIAVCILLAMVIVPTVGVGWASYRVAVLVGASKLGAAAISLVLGAVTYFVMVKLGDRVFGRPDRPIGML